MLCRQFEYIQLDDRWIVEMTNAQPFVGLSAKAVNYILNATNKL